MFTVFYVSQRSYTNDKQQQEKRKAKKVEILLRCEIKTTDQLSIAYFTMRYKYFIVFININK